MNFYLRLLFLAFLFSAVACTSPRKMARALAHQSVDLALSELFKIHKKGTIALPLENGMGNENFTPYRFVRFVPSIRKGMRGDTLVVDYEFYDSTWRARAHQLIDIIFKDSMRRTSYANPSVSDIVGRKFWLLDDAFAANYLPILKNRFAKGSATLFLAEQNSLISADGYKEHDEYDDPIHEVYELEYGILKIEIQGVLSPNRNYCSPAGTKDYVRLVNEASKDDSVRGVFLDIDSPGGASDGVQKLYQAIRDCPKPVVAYVNNNMCSGAYWLGCAADAIYVASMDTTSAGSIGAYALWTGTMGLDEQIGLTYEYITAKQSTQKILGNPHEPLSDEARKLFTAQLTDLCQAFINDIKAVRPDVDERAFTGASFSGRKCIELGLVDDVGTEEQALMKLSNLIRSQKI